MSKGGHPDLPTWSSRINRNDILYDAEKSLEALRTDYIDMYLLHRDDKNVPIGEIMETMQELVESGKVRVIGGSNWTCERIDEANEYAAAHGLTKFIVSSPHYGLAEQSGELPGDSVTVTGEKNSSAREWYMKNQMPLFAYSSLGSGLFSGKIKSYEIDKIGTLMDEFSLMAYGSERNYTRLARCEEIAAQKNATVAQVALAWLLKGRINAFALISSHSIERIAENIRAFDLCLTDEEMDYLNLM